MDGPRNYVQKDFPLSKDRPLPSRRPFFKTLDWFSSQMLKLILVEWSYLILALEIEPEGDGLDFDNELVE